MEKCSFAVCVFSYSEARSVSSLCVIGKPSWWIYTLKQIVTAMKIPMNLHQISVSQTTLYKIQFTCKSWSCCPICLNLRPCRMRIIFRLFFFQEHATLLSIATHLHVIADNSKNVSIRSKA